MRRFLFGAFVGVIIVAVAVTFLPDRAHSLIDQAGEVRELLEDVVTRLDRLESSETNVEPVEIVLPENPSWTTRSDPVSMPAVVEAVAPAASAIPAAASSPPIASTTEAAAPLPPEVGRQMVDFDKLATGLSRVSGALERLNRTMKPGTRRQGSTAARSDADPSS